MSAPFILSYIVLWIVVVVQAVVVLGLARLVHELQQGGTGLPAPDGEGLAGQPAPALTATDVFGESVALSSFAGRQTAVLFVSPTCSTCVVTLEELEALESKVDGNVIIVCASDNAACQRMAEEYSLRVPVIADPDDQISKSFDVTMPPTAVLVSKGGRILQYGHPGDGPHLSELLQEDPLEVEQAG